MATEQTNELPNGARSLQDVGRRLAISFDEWKALGVDGAVKYLTDYYQLSAESGKKLAVILRHEWEKPSNDRAMPRGEL